MPTPSEAKRSFVTKLRNRVPLFAVRPVIFFHIPKCGGSTVTRFLHKQYLPEHVFQIDGQNPKDSVEQFKSFSEEKRRSYRLVIGHAAQDLLDYVGSEWISMTVLRDPIDRIVSHYYYAKRDSRHYLHGRIQDESIGLLDYVAKPLTREVQNWHVTRFSELDFSEVAADPQRAIDLAFNFVTQRFQVVGFLDDLSAAMNRLGEIAGFHSRFQNGTYNKTKDRPKIEQVDADVLQEITDLNSLDVELYKRLQAHRVA